MAHYTTYWKDYQVTANLNEFLDHAASEQFGSLEKGDTIWIVNIQTGTGAFRLIGRLLVNKVTDQRGAEAALRGRDLYEATYHVLSARGNAERCHVVPLDAYAAQLRFEGDSPTLSIRDGKVYAQQVRSLRRLTPESAALLTDAWLDYHGAIEVPPASEYVRALEQLSRYVRPVHKQLLAAQYAAYGHETTARYLADSICQGDVGTTNLRYGGLARRLCETLDVVPTRRADGSPRWWNVLARGWEGPNGFVWKMRPEVAEALEILGWVEPGTDDREASRPESVADVDEDSAVAREGRPRWRTHLRRERAPQIIRKKKQAYRATTGGLRCEACEFDFDAAFGLADFCEVHHLIPLAADDEERTTRLEDLAVLCSNCHRAIHRLGPPMPTVEELRNLILRNRR